MKENPEKLKFIWRVFSIKRNLGGYNINCKYHCCPVNFHSNAICLSFENTWLGGSPRSSVIKSHFSNRLSCSSLKICCMHFSNFDWNLTNAISKYMHMAIHICVITAFLLVPINDLIFRFCLTHVHVVPLPFRDRHKLRQVTRMIQTHMQFYRAFGFTKIGPGKNR